MGSQKYLKAERTAISFLEKHKISEPFVNVFELAKSEGILLNFATFNKKFERVAGFFDNDTKTIFVNKDQATNRQTFTIAHELGHFLLGHEPNRYGVHMRWPEPNQEKSEIEIEADVFAANLLVPREMIERIKRKYKLCDNDVDLLARIFGVSLSMMTFRLQWLRQNQ